ncbi:MAG: hypothetical protein EOM19_01740 [Candidatus Moranbacteria bacterium]|nr:hypothetical protein [Candidatus Moranbacteria bacterium]
MKKMVFFSFIFSSLGTLYSFILFYPYLLNGGCAFGSTCNTLLEIPICFFGFIGFFLVSILFWMVLLSQEEERQIILMQKIFWITFAGMLFALFYLIQELFTQKCFDGICFFSFEYPSCLVGFVLFLALFSVSRYLLRKEI